MRVAVEVSDADMVTENPREEPLKVRRVKRMTTEKVDAEITYKKKR